MCNPAFIAIGLSLASGAATAYSAVQQGKAANNAAKYTAAVDEQNAQSALEQKKLIEEQRAIDNRRLGEAKARDVGDLTAKAAASGFDSGFGSPADLIGDTSNAYRIDQGLLLKGADAQKRTQDVQAYNYQTDAGLQLQKGRDAQKAGWLTAGASLLGSASTIAGQWKPSGPVSPIYSSNTTLPKWG